MSTFHPPGVVGRGGETQLQVEENSDNLAGKGIVIKIISLTNYHFN